MSERTGTMGNFIVDWWVPDEMAMLFWAAQQRHGVCQVCFIAGHVAGVEQSFLYSLDTIYLMIPGQAARRPRSHRRDLCRSARK